MGLSLFPFELSREANSRDKVIHNSVGSVLLRSYSLVLIITISIIVQCPTDSEHQRHCYVPV